MKQEPSAVSLPGATGAGPKLQRHLGLGDVVSIIVGIVVGAGIYKTPPDVFANVSSPGMALAIWAACGLLSLIGALCYAELASTYPYSGGDYFYLTRAFGSWLGFLFAWTQLILIRSGNIGLMAFVFAEYGARLIDPHTDRSANEHWLWAAGSIVALTALNLIGVAYGKRTQNLLTAAKVVGLGGIVVAGLGWPAPEGSLNSLPSESPPRLALALVLVFLTYGGWSDAAFVAAEVRGGPRNIVRALVLGTSAIMLIYLLVNAAYLRGLGWEDARHSRAIAAEVLARPLEKWGARTMCVLVMISALGAVNGMLFSGARIYASLGSDHALLAWLGRWHLRRGTPWAAILVQSGLCLGLIFLLGSRPGQQLLNTLLGAAGLAEQSWQGVDGFDVLLACTAPAFWLFLLMTSLALLVLRHRDTEVQRPFSTPFHPLLPCLFCTACAGMLYSSIEYAHHQGLLAGQALLLGSVLVSGVVLHGISRHRQASR